MSATEKYISLRKSNIAIKFYIISERRIAIQLEKNLFIKIRYSSNWYNYIKKTSIKIRPFEIRRFLKDLKDIRIKYKNWKNLIEPKKERIL